MKDLPDSLRKMLAKIIKDNNTSDTEIELSVVHKDDLELSNMFHLLNKSLWDVIKKNKISPPEGFMGSIENGPQTLRYSFLPEDIEKLMKSESPIEILSLIKSYLSLINGEEECNCATCQLKKEYSENKGKFYDMLAKSSECHKTQNEPLPCNTCEFNTKCLHQKMEDM